MITTASSMARGSPARTIRAHEPANVAVHTSCRRHRRLSASCRRARSAIGTQLIPATNPKCGTWAAMAPPKAKDRAPRKLAAFDRRDARRKARAPSPATHHVTMRLIVHATVPENTANSNVRGYAARIPPAE